MTVPSWWQRPRQVSVVVDNDSWILPFAEKIVVWANAHGDVASLARRHEDVTKGAVAFYLGCVKISPEEVLARNQLNLVVHESDLPRGRGWSPVTWLILEGAVRIPVCLIEIIPEVDAGPIIYKEWCNLSGDELIGQIRNTIGEMTVGLCQRFLDERMPPKGSPQSGEATTYRRRRPEDSRLDPQGTIRDQFNLLRVVDNERYPAFFELFGQRYELQIRKKDRTEVRINEPEKKDDRDHL